LPVSPPCHRPGRRAALCEALGKPSSRPWNQVLEDDDWLTGGQGSPHRLGPYAAKLRRLTRTKRPPGEIPVREAPAAASFLTPTEGVVTVAQSGASPRSRQPATAAVEPTAADAPASSVLRKMQLVNRQRRAAKSSVLEPRKPRDNLSAATTRLSGSPKSRSSRTGGVVPGQYNASQPGLPGTPQQLQ